MIKISDIVTSKITFMFNMRTPIDFLNANDNFAAINV